MFKCCLILQPFDIVAANVHGLKWLQQVLIFTATIVFNLFPYHIIAKIPRTTNGLRQADREEDNTARHKQKGKSNREMAFEMRVELFIRLALNQTAQDIIETINKSFPARIGS